MRREATTNIDDAVCFRPSRVEGLANVEKVCIGRDVLELVSAGKRLTFPFLAFAHGREVSSDPRTHATLDYAARVARPRHSFFSLSAAAMAGLTVAWLLYVQFARPRYHQGGTLWEVLWQWSMCPGVIGVILAMAGLTRIGRKRFLSILAITVIVLAYLLLPPPMNFA